MKIAYIPDLGRRLYTEKYKYDYKENKSICPVCKGLGIPWGGWFSCESKDCGVVALVEDGRVFLPIRGRFEQIINSLFNL